MPSASAALRAVGSLREAIARISRSALFFMPGSTRSRPILAVLNTPQITFFIRVFPCGGSTANAADSNRSACRRNAVTGYDILRKLANERLGFTVPVIEIAGGPLERIEDLAIAERCYRKIFAEFRILADFGCLARGDRHVFQRRIR